MSVLISDNSGKSPPRKKRKLSAAKLKDQEENKNTDRSVCEERARKEN